MFLRQCIRIADAAKARLLCVVAVNRMRANLNETDIPDCQPAGRQYAAEVDLL